MRRISSSSNPQFTITTPKTIIIIFPNSVYICSRLLPSYTHVIGQNIPRHHSTIAQYALQQIVESFSNLLCQLAKHHSTHTYQLVFCFCERKNIDYLILRYLNPGGNHSMNFRRIGYLMERLNLCLHRRRLLEAFRFGSSCETRTRGWISGRN
jgi:hypothetical protein